MIDTSLLFIEKTIIHYVPTSKDPNIQPILSTSILELSEAEKNMLTERITKVLGNGSNCLEMRICDTTEMSAATQIANILNDTSSDETFIQKTSNLAQKLYSTQSNNRTTPGILLCIFGRTGSSQQQFVALIKAEKQAGFRVDMQTLQNLELINDLFLTPSQKLYKVAFWLRVSTTTPISPSDLQIHIFDQNALHNGTSRHAAYFSHSFSGCAPLENAPVQTEKFYNNTKDFITSNPTFTDIQKVELTNSLHTYLKSDQSTVINTQDFAITYFPDPEIADQYCSRMKREGFPETAVTKDITRLRPRLRHRKITFSSGVKISFESQNNSNDLIKIDGYNKDTNYTTISIQGKISAQES